MKKPPNMNILLDMYLCFMKIGGLTLGGGYAMIPIIQKEAVDNKKWVSESEFVDYITLAQSVPGVVGINTATAVGNKVAGKLGSVVATLGMITPSVVIIILIAGAYQQLERNHLLQSAFSGVRGAVVALIFAAVFRLSQTTTKEAFQLVIAAAVVICILFFKISPPIMILSGAVAGLLYNRRRA